MITAWLDDIELSWDEPPTPTPTPTPGPQTATATAVSVTWGVPAASAHLLTYAESVALDGPVLWYREGESSGDALDSSGNGYTGTRVGSPLLAQTGAHTDTSKSQDFDGSDDYIAGPNMNLFGGSDYGSDFTIELWFRAHALGGPFLSQTRAATPTRRGFQCYIWTDGYAFDLVNDAGTSYGFAEMVSGRDDNAWHHVVIEKSGTTYTIYVDGEVSSQQTLAVSGTFTAADRVTVGTSMLNGTHSDHPNGLMQDAAVYTKALGLSRVAVHYLLGGPPVAQERAAVAVASTWGVSRAWAQAIPTVTPTPVGGDPDIFANPTPVVDPDVFTDTSPSVDPDTTATDQEATCLMNTTACVNVALSRIGVSKQIASFSSDTNKEAVLARLHWGLDVNRCLRDFPWGFATKYHTLTPVIGNETAAANGDWQYGYLLPDDCVMVRRVIPPSGVRRAYDANPVVFRLGTTAAGATLFTNQECPVQIEYTYRYECPAAAPDSHFRSALAWRLAASLVSPLARDAKLVDYCELKYRQELALAGAGQGNEQQMEKDGDAGWISAR